MGGVNKKRRNMFEEYSEGVRTSHHLKSLWDVSIENQGVIGIDGS